MGTQISINILDGNESVGDDDRGRAEDAALAVLAAAGIEPATAYAEFLRQWVALGEDDDGPGQDYEHLTGDAALWVAAERAADLALTQGWANPNGASCGISA